jgi:hypothetical protein
LMVIVTSESTVMDIKGSIIVAVDIAAISPAIEPMAMLLI